MTISSTYNIASAFGFNGDVAIFNRALTASEKALITRYMQRGVPLLGANLVKNSSFATDLAHWGKDAWVNASWDSGTAKVAPVGYVGLAQVIAGSQAGKTYLCKVSVTAAQSGNEGRIYVLGYDSNPGSGYPYSGLVAVGATSVLVVVAPGVTIEKSIGLSSKIADQWANYDNASVQEIL